jgi:hypothetical protein
MRKIPLTTFAAGTVLSVVMFGNSAGALTFAAPLPMSAAKDAIGVQKAALCCDWFGYFACWRFPDHRRHYRPYGYGWRCL